MNAAQIAAALRFGPLDGPFLDASAELLADVFTQAKGGSLQATSLWLRVAANFKPAPLDAPAAGELTLGRPAAAGYGDGPDEIEQELARSLL